MNDQEKQSFIERLRDFADRLEKCEDDLPDCDIRIGFYRIQEQEKLRAVAGLADARHTLEQVKSGKHHWMNLTIAGFDSAAHFNPEILGTATKKTRVVTKKYKQTVQDIVG